MRPRSVKCPTCEAEVNEDCREVDGSTLLWRGSHAARVKAARDAR